MKLYYLSSTCYSDCDISLLHLMSKKYEITYGLIIPHKNSNFSREVLQDYCNKNQIVSDFYSLSYRYRNPKNFITFFKLIRNVIKANPDIIYINNFDQIYFNIAIMFLDKLKTIVAIHDVVSHSGSSNNTIVRIIRNLLIMRFNLFLSFSSSQLKYFKYLYPKKDICMIPLALKDFGRKPDYERLDNVKNFLFFGNIKKYKGMDLLLNSVSRLSKEYSSFKLIIAGRCEDWENLYENRIKNYNVIEKHIRFIDNSEIPSFFSKADYLVLPYKDATQSGPLMIAYNYNLPVIASNIPGFKEFIEDGETGILFDLDNERSLDKAIKFAITQDKESYNKFINNIILYKEKHFSTEYILNSYFALFDSINNN